MAVFFAEILAGYTAGSVFLIIVIISPLLLFFFEKTISSCISYKVRIEKRILNIFTGGHFLNSFSNSRNDKKKCYTLLIIGFSDVISLEIFNKKQSWGSCSNGDGYYS